MILLLFDATQKMIVFKKVISQTCSRKHLVLSLHHKLSLSTSSLKSSENILRSSTSTKNNKFGKTLSRIASFGIATGVGYIAVKNLTDNNNENDDEKLFKSPSAVKISRKSSIIQHPSMKEIQLDINSAYHVISHPEKKRGEDAAFISEHQNVFGVFDGVSGAPKIQGYPLYSEMLSSKIYSYAQKEVIPFRTMKDLIFSLEKAKGYADMYATGASTALLAAISPEGILRALNVGDSTLLVIRNNNVIIRTDGKTHSFNTPYQLAKHCPDHPQDGTKLEFQLESGDIIVMASDGVLDNLFEKQILSLVSNQKHNQNTSKGNNDNKLVHTISPEILTNDIIKLARKISMNSNVETPFSLAFKQNYEAKFGSATNQLMRFFIGSTDTTRVAPLNLINGKGGKMDDMACIVIVISHHGKETIR